MVIKSPPLPNGNAGDDSSSTSSLSEASEGFWPADAVNPDDADDQIVDEVPLPATPPSCPVEGEGSKGEKEKGKKRSRSPSSSSSAAPVDDAGSKSCGARARHARQRTRALSSSDRPFPPDPRPQSADRPEDELLRILRVAPLVHTRPAMPRSNRARRREQEREREVQRQLDLAHRKEETNGGSISVDSLVKVAAIGAAQILLIILLWIVLLRSAQIDVRVERKEC